MMEKGKSERLRVTPLEAPSGWQFEEHADG